MITRGNQQDLQLNPGSHSADPDQDTFNATVYVQLRGVIFPFATFSCVELEVRVLLSNLRHRRCFPICKARY